MQRSLDSGIERLEGLNLLLNCLRAYHATKVCRRHPPESEDNGSPKMRGAGMRDARAPILQYVGGWSTGRHLLRTRNAPHPVPPPFTPVPSE
jgi:hypothetical protein